MSSDIGKEIETAELVTLKPPERIKFKFWKNTLLILIIFILAAAFIVLFFIAYPKTYTQPILTPVPIIGVLSKPLWEENYDVVTNKSQVIEAKYVRWIEGGGGKPIFINYNSSEDHLKNLFNQINGLMLIGGAAELVEYDKEKGKNILTLYGKKVKYMIDIAIKANDNGDYFPIWGTCLGYEILLLAFAEDCDLLKGECNCFNYTDVLNFTQEAYSSRVYSFLTDEQLELLGTVPMTYNSHNYYVTTEDFYKNSKLYDEFKVLSTSSNKNRTFSFISSVEAIRYPFYAVQFHPEKSMYDFNPTHNFEHSLSSIMVMQRFPIFFVNEARKNGHVFIEDEEEHIVYNGEMGFDSRLGPLYLFP